MNEAHIHLVLTHFPIVGTILGTGILIYSQIVKDNSAAKIAFLTLILMSLLTIPVFLTGEGAEESVEHLAGVSENLIEEHEDLAAKAIWFMAVLGVFSFAGLFSIYKKMTFSKVLNPVLLVIALVTCGLFVKVGNLGGQIRHSEIRNTGSNGQAESTNGHQDQDEDDDDN